MKKRRRKPKPKTCVFMPRNVQQHGLTLVRGLGFEKTDSWRRAAFGPVTIVIRARTIRDYSGFTRQRVSRPTLASQVGFCGKWHPKDLKPMDEEAEQLLSAALAAEMLLHVA